MSDDAIATTIFAVFGGTMFFLHYRHTEALRKQVLTHGYHTHALVTKYQEDVMRVAGGWHSLEYPYVTYISEAGEVRQERLRYASSRGQLLWVGQELEIVVYEGLLYYLPALKESYWSGLLS